MFDTYCLPEYLLGLTNVVNARGQSRTSTINSATDGNVWGGSTPENVNYPYVVCSDAEGLDYGQTADEDMPREMGFFHIYIVGRRYRDIDQLHRDIVDACKMVNQQYLPSNSANPKMFVQAIILKEGRKFEYRPVDGSEQCIVGYDLTIKAAYDP